MADPAISVSVTAGSPIVTGTLTSFVAAAYDIFVLGGVVGIVDSRQSTTQITLKQPWSGPTQSGRVDFVIVNTGPYWHSAVTTNRRMSDLLTKWESGPVKWDASGTLSGRANYNNQPVGFAYLSVDPLPFTLYVKIANANAASDWSSGQAIYQKADSTLAAEAAASAAQGSASSASASASATADDRARTGQDRTAAAASASAAAGSAASAQTSAGNAAASLANAALKGDNADIGRLRGVSNAGIDFWATETALSAQGTVDLGGISTLKVALTFTGPVTGFGAGANRYRICRAANPGTLTPGSSLFLPTGSPIVTSAGDTWTAVSDPSGIWRVLGYQKADGSPLKSPAISDVAGLQTALDSRLRFDAAQTLSDTQASQAAANGKLMLGDASNFGPTGFRNRFVNGDLSVWQKGVSFANPGSGAAICDMVRLYFDGAGGSYTLSRAPRGDDRQGGIRYVQTAAESGGSYRVLVFYIESARTLAGKRAVVSFEAFRDASQTDRTVLLGAPYQNFGSGGSPSASVFSSVVAQSSSFVVTGMPSRFFIVADIPSVAGKTFGSNADDAVRVDISLPRNVTWDFTIRNFQFEEISTAAPLRPSPFENIGAALTLARCQRYLRKTYEPDTAPGTATTAGMVSNIADAAQSYVFLDNIRFDPPMRAAPAITLYNPTTGGTTSPIRNFNTNSDSPANIANIAACGCAINVAASNVGASNTIGAHLVADASFA